jgi:acyl-CoA hydrolase
VSVEHPKIISAQEAAALVQSGSWVDYGMGLPEKFDEALAARTGELRDVGIRAVLSMKPPAVIAADPKGESFHLYSWHFSGLDRKLHAAGRAHYLPMNFGEAPDD